MGKLKPKTLSKLKRIFPQKSENTLRARISQISSKYGFTLGAAAEILARQEKKTVWGTLNPEDRKCFRGKEIKIIKIKEHRRNNKKETLIFYNTTDKLLDTHIKEINNCYNAHCYTASFILIRKVLENLIIGMIKFKFPSKSKQDKEIYLDPSNRWRTRDFSEIIKNFRNKCTSFEREEERLVLRILQLSEQFKDDANDKTHSLYHLSNKSELYDKNPQNIFNLIEQFFKEHQE